VAPANYPGLLALRRPYVFSEIQVLLPHWHSNMWNVRPVAGSCNWQ